MPTVPPPSRDTTVDPVVFWFRYRTELLVGLIVILLVVLGFIGYRVYVNYHDARAAEALAGAHSIPEYQRVIEKYPGTPASASAYLLLAENLSAEKRFKEANETLQKFIDKFPQHELISSARFSMAANLEAMGKKDEALSMLQRLVASAPKNFIAPMALLAQIHLLKEKGKTTEARQLCENFLTQHRESPLAGEVSRQLRLLKPVATPSPTATVSPPASVSPTVALPPNPTPKKP